MTTDLSPKILFAAYGGGHVAMVAPVSQEMSRRGFRSSMLALTTARTYLDQRGIAYTGYNDLPEAKDPAVRAYGVELAGQQTPGPAPVPYEESVAYHGVNFVDLVHEHGEAGARLLFAARQRQAFLPLRTMTRLLERERPDLVVVTTSPRTEEALALAARALGIPVVCMVDLFEVHGMAPEKYPEYADRFLVLNEKVRSALISYGCSPEQVMATGNPAFDRLRDPDTRAAGIRLRQRHGWQADQKVVLWASQVEPALHPFTGLPGDPSLPGRIEQSLRDYVAGHEKTRLVVRYHPSERRTFVPGVRTEFSPVQQDVGELLNAVDIVVVMTSTIGLEAAIVGKRVITVENSMFADSVPYSALGIAEGVENPSKLSSALERATNGDGPSRQASDVFAAGTATEAACAALEAVLCCSSPFRNRD